MKISHQKSHTIQFILQSLKTGELISFFKITLLKLSFNLAVLLPIFSTIEPLLKNFSAALKLNNLISWHAEGTCNYFQHKTLRKVTLQVNLFQMLSRSSLKLSKMMEIFIQYCAWKNKVEFIPG